MDSDSLLPRSISFQLPDPVIDFSNQTLKPGSSKWDEVKTDVPMEELFELPIQTKQRNVYSQCFHGYLCHNLHQSFGIVDLNVLEKVSNFTQLLWPDHGNKSISETIHLFSEQLVELDLMVRRMIMESFGIEKYIDEHLNSTYYLTRLMKYTSPPDDDDDEETKLGLRSHTDKNIITILHQYQVDGLEVKTKDDKWIKVKPSQDSVLVMVGDSLCALLNGRLHSPYHRVIMTGEKTRYSTGLFSIPKTGVIIDSPEELVDKEHPRIFKPFEYTDFLHFFQTEAGRIAQSALHAFAAF
ncbi:unnamed protein product [Arabidopsis thaliana]|uniref:Fe2OG dioxygenase domain-containing protein n=1 Tax=Arabidopsis thaliana TaxID=3702 RepID=A0A5S9XQ74_ARATH|nr:unnamed protein product [Arabidopsis thaliana]